PERLPLRRRRAEPRPRRLALRAAPGHPGALARGDGDRPAVHRGPGLRDLRAHGAARKTRRRKLDGRARVRAPGSRDPGRELERAPGTPPRPHRTRVRPEETVPLQAIALEIASPAGALP